MNMKPFQRLDVRRKDGIALVIVLGLLSALMLLAVAFAISMRVERLAARNYSDMTRAKQLVYVGLARAIEQVNLEMAGKAYPDETVFPMGCLALLGGEASNLVPGSVWAGNPGKEMAWDTIEAGGRKHGRYAYVALDCSGLLDANFVGGTEQTNGYSPGEIQLDELPEVGNPDWMAANRAIDGQYETVAELWWLNRRNRAIGGKALKAFPENLFVYSHDQQQYLETGTPGTDSAAVKNKMLNLSAYDVDNMTEGELLDLHDNLETIFNKLIEPSYERWNDVAWNLINYMDSDNIPAIGVYPQHNECEGSDSGPLFNEIVLAPVGSNYEFRVEVWFPFTPARIKDKEYEVVVDVYHQQIGWDKALRRIDPQELRNNSKICLWSSGRGKHFLGAMYWPDRQFEVIQTGVIPVINKEFDKNRKIYARVTLYHCEKDIRTDEASGWRPNWGENNSNVPLDWEVGKCGGFMINDPRKNCERNLWKQNWRGEGKDTLGAFNDGACECYGQSYEGPSGTFTRDNVPIYIRNGPLESVAELGHIFRSNPLNWKDTSRAHPPDFWLSIDLSDPRMARVVDYITVHPTNAAPRGLVNINTKNKDVLKAMLEGLQPRDYPDASDAYKIDIDKAVNAILKYRQTAAFKNVGDLSNVKELLDCLDSAPENDYSREAVLRSLMSLGTAQQNLFTVIVTAQAFAPGGTLPVSEQKAAATVWRDAYTGKSFLRSVKWIAE
ncbi:MAG: hypothetical protein JXR37_35770 [Kiritimatiellae bacterium]|nr:hypothetical protein [Kiritimatiellia bacterium]